MKNVIGKDKLDISAITKQKLTGEQCNLPSCHYCLLLFLLHCGMPYIDEASLITMDPLKTGGNAGWFTSWQEGSKNPERNQFKNLFLIGGKDVTDLFSNH